MKEQVQLIPSADRNPSLLVITKLSPPQRRASLVFRPRLLDLLMGGIEKALTLVCAPAGYGKSTLLAEWAACLSRTAAQRKVKICWLSLDEGDNDPNTFLRYLVAACENANPQPASETLGNEARAMLGVYPPVPFQTILGVLINHLHDFPGLIYLVLDDYQFINNPSIHEGLAYFLDHLPAAVHVVIATRSDPPLPLARLRVGGQLAEIRADDLRFNQDEAGAFLNQVMNLSISDENIANLEDRTEGWIAGLQMAALAVYSLSRHGQKDISQFIQDFSGSHHYILDYLVEEVLGRQPESIRTFLIKTSILDRLCAPLCDAVLASDAALPAQAVLEQMERENVFLIALDEDRRWYRYHHLFADLLRSRLDHQYHPEVPKLHLRAAAWYEQSGSTLEAIHHASLASDFERVERLIEQNYIEMMNRGEMTWVRYWMGNLSKELVYRRPWLCLYEAFSRSWFGQLDEAELLLAAAEKSIQSESSAPAGISSADLRAMLGYHAYVQSRVCAMQGDTLRAIALCLSARENIPASNVALQIETGITLGYEYFLVGEFPNASKTLHAMIQICYTVGAINNPVAAYALLARSLVVQGRLRAAFDLFQKAAQLIHESGGQYFGAGGLVELGTADLLCEWNVLETALARVKQGLDYLPYWGKADDLALAYITLARIQLAQGSRAEAAGTIEKAAKLIQTCGVFTEARSAVETAQVKMWLAQEDWPAVDRWTAALEKCFGSPDPFRYEDELMHITQARVCIAQQKPAEAVQLLSRLEESARTGGRLGRLIEILMLKAIALPAAGDTTQADIALAESLALAEPEGYLQIFLDEGEALRVRIEEFRNKLRKPGPDVSIEQNAPMVAYIEKILSAFSSLHPASPVGPGEHSSVLVERLTPREQEVLHLVAQGCSNKQVAEKLVLAEGTVKYYMHVILQKLEVQTRTQAIARARELNLI